MSDYASIVDRVRRSNAAVSRLEAALEADPVSAALQINLSAAKKRAEINQAELLSISMERHIEVCNYRLLPAATKHYGLSQVSSSLLAYQNLFTQVHDAKINGPKSNLVAGKNAIAQSALDFAYSYSGSLGVALFIQNEKTLFSGVLDPSIDAFFDVLKIDSVADAKQVIGELGAAVVKRTHDWSSANLDAGFAADIRWNRSDGRQTGEVIERRRMEQLVNVIGSSSDKKSRIIRTTGRLIGGDLGSKSFHFVVPDGASYRGYQAADFVSEVIWTLGEMYEAVIREQSTFYYATDRSTVSFELVALRKFNPSASPSLEQ